VLIVIYHAGAKRNSGTARLQESAEATR